MPSGYSDEAKKQGIRKTDPKIQPPYLGISGLMIVIPGKTTYVYVFELGKFVLNKNSKIVATMLAQKPHKLAIFQDLTH